MDAGADHGTQDGAGTTPPADVPPPPAAPLEPLALPMRRVVEAGLVLWAVALVLVLVVPALHTGPRAWWPWCCVAGLVLGAVGWVYVRRGRGNAAAA